MYVGSVCECVCGECVCMWGVYVYVGSVCGECVCGECMWGVYVYVGSACVCGEYVCEVHRLDLGSHQP